MGPEQWANQVRLLPADKQSVFPNLQAGNYCVTSEEDHAYNCIAYAAGVTTTRWWPPVDGPIEGVDWPNDAPCEQTIEAFIAAYATRGYSICDNGTPEEGFEKIAIYVDSDGEPTHAARQLMPSGQWTSKLGFWEDICHITLSSLEGTAYGTVAKFLRRKSFELTDQPLEAN